MNRIKVNRIFNLTAIILVCVGQLHAFQEYNAKSKEPLVFRTLLIVKRFTDVEHEGRRIRERMRTKDISSASHAFKSYTPYWIKRLTNGRIRWEADVVVSDIPLTSVSPAPKGFWVTPGDVKEDIKKYVPVGKYDSIFIYWKPGEISGGFGWAIGPTPAARYCGYTCVAFMEPEHWKRKNETTEVFIHEWLHQLEAFYGARGVQLPKGKLHGAQNYGFKGKNGWKDWYKAFMNGTIKEHDKTFSGLGENAWKHGTIRYQYRIVTPEFITPVRRRINRIRDGSFEFTRRKDNPWWINSKTESNAVITVDTSHAHHKNSSLLLESTTGGVISVACRVKLKPQTVYLLSGWIKTEGVEPVGQWTDSGASLYAEEARMSTMMIKGTNDWKYVITVFNTWQKDSFTIVARLGHDTYPASGKAWFDDITLTSLKNIDVPPFNYRYDPLE
jgi:hypothetical protein